MKRLIFLLFTAFATIAVSQLHTSRLTLVESIAIRVSERRVQQELNLSPNKIEDVERIIRKHAAMQAAINDKMAMAKEADVSGLTRQMESLESTTAKEIVSILDAGQRERLLQIAVQDVGPFSLRSPIVANRVGVTNSQAKQIEGIAAKTMAELNVLSEQVGKQIDSIPTGKSGDSKRQAVAKSYTTKSEQIEVRGAKAVLAILSAAQRKKWEAIQGKPFKL